MIRLIAFAAFAIVVTTSAQAIPVAPIEQPDSMVTEVVAGCGVGRTRVNGVCVARHHQTSSSQMCAMEWKYLRELLLNRHRDRGFGADLVKARGRLGWRPLSF